MVHGLAVSVAVHAAVGFPFIVYTWPRVNEEPPLLVVELQGVTAESQVEQAVAEQTKGAEPQEAPTPPTPQTPPPAEPQRQPEQEQPKLEAEEPPKEEQQKDDEALASQPPPQAQAQPAQTLPSPTPSSQPPTSPPSPDMANTSGASENRIAQTIRQDEDERQRISEYVKLLSKKVQSKLVYPDDGRKAGLQGVATVSFTVLADGQIRPETLKVVRSSGQSRLDASALQTIRTSTPFDTPPREMTVSIDVEYARIK